MNPGDTESDWKCHTCEFVCKDRTQMAHHQYTNHNRVFRVDEQGKVIGQMGHILWFIKILEYGTDIWEVRSTRLDPKAPKLPTGNLDKESLMPFGKHKGTPLKDMSTTYLNWIYNNTEKKPFNRGVFVYIKKNIKKFEESHPHLKWKLKNESKN